MGFTLTVKGQETIFYGVDVITSAHMDVSTPINSLAKSTNVSTTIWMTGKLIDESNSSDTHKLLEWSLVPAQRAEAYRDVTINVIAADQTFRTIEFPNAFVIQYNEIYTNTMGAGDFRLILGQKVDQFDKIKTKGPQGLQSSDDSLGDFSSQKESPIMDF